MKFNIFLIVLFYCMITSFCFEVNETSDFNECEIWIQRHVYIAEDIHFYNKTFQFVKIDSLNDLNITTRCRTLEFKISTLEIFARQSILLDNDLDLSGVLNVFNLSHTQRQVWFLNIKGFNEKNSELTTIHSHTYEITSLVIMNVNFEFYREGTQLQSDECKMANFSSKTNDFFGQLRNLLLVGNVFYNSKICPYVFMNTKLESLHLYEISTSLIFMNRFEFLNISETEMNNNFQFIQLCIYNGQISLLNLNPFAFKTLKFLLIKGNLESFDEDLFENFKEISYISVKSDDLINFFHRGTKWLNSINKNLNVSLSSIDFRKNIHKLVSIEFVSQSWLFFNRFYTYPNEDICLFKNFPHTQLVLPLIIFDPAKFDSNEYSCTLVWLQQYYKLYFSRDFTVFSRFINIDPEYKDLFVNETLGQYRMSEEKFDSCNFTQRFEKCDFNNKLKIFPLNSIFSLRFVIKWLQYVIEVYFRTIICFIGLITNTLTLKVIRNKKHPKSFSNSMYKHICGNALFNIGYCLIYLLSLMNICIYRKTSFCSSIYRTEFAEYFYIYVILFLGNTFRLCCNISYLFFSISRFALSGTSNKSKLRKFIEKQNVKRFYIIVFILTLGFSSFLVFENKVNKLLEDFAGSDAANLNRNNVYDKRYCDISLAGTDKNANFNLTPSFYIGCEIFKWFNLVNNILNNGLFLIISIFVDIFMISFSNKVIQKKKALHCPHLSEAIDYKAKLNKMIITNGTLYFFSHFPEFLAILTFYLSKSNNIINFCYMTFDCTSFIEMAQAFHFISIGLQFFIFLIFDHNIKNSFLDLKIFQC
jgi:hypothetical protein